MAQDELDVAVEAFVAALKRHTEIIRSHADDPVAVTDVGECLVRSAQQHEAALMKITGWSSPLRHLGRVSVPEDFDLDRPMDPASVRLTVDVHYILDITNPALVIDTVQGRFGDSDRGDLQSAVERLLTAEGWNPADVAGHAILVRALSVVVTGDGDDSKED